MPGHVYSTCSIAARHIEFQVSTVCSSQCMYYIFALGGDQYTWPSLNLNRLFDRAMASGAGKSTALSFLIINAVLYIVVIIIAGCSANQAIEKARKTASLLTFPERIFPIYFPLGNMATGLFVIFSLIAGVVGFITSVGGMNNVRQWDARNLHAAAASSLATWTLTLLALGFAWNEIDIGWEHSNLVGYIETALHEKTHYHFVGLRALETMLIILSGTQLFATAAIHVGVEDVVARDRAYGGRV